MMMRELWAETVTDNQSPFEHDLLANHLRRKINMTLSSIVKGGVGQKSWEPWIRMALELSPTIS